MRKQLYWLIIALGIAVCLSGCTHNQEEAAEGTGSSESAGFPSIPDTDETLESTEWKAEADTDAPGTEDKDEAVRNDETKRILHLLENYIQEKETLWFSKLNQQISDVGLKNGQYEISYSEQYEDLSEEILAMMAVHCNYQFDNYAVCRRYINELWEDIHIIQVRAGNMVFDLARTAPEETEEEETDWLEFLKKVPAENYPVSIVLSTFHRQSLYEKDGCDFRYYWNWEGWTDEKKEECRLLMEMDKEKLWEVLIQRQQANRLYSPVVLYYQGGEPWCDNVFGGGTIATDGCCPTAIAMVLSCLKEREITPDVVAAKYDSSKYRSMEYGSYGAVMCKRAGKEYGLKTETGNAQLSKSEILTALEAGKKIVVSMKPGRYTSVYHYVVLAGLTQDGMVIVNNPGMGTNISYDSIDTVYENQSGRNYGIFWIPASAVQE